MRINARLDEQAEQQITWLTEATGQSVSHVVREAVRQYYTQVRAQRSVGPRHLLAMVGQGDSGATDLSTRYKEELAGILEAKYPRHPRHPRPKAG